LQLLRPEIKEILKVTKGLKKRIRGVVEKLRPEIAKTKTFREKGNLLHQAMHTFF